MADAPPSEYPHTPIQQWNSNIKALQGLQFSRDPRTCAPALASRENSTLLGPSSTTWWQDTSWPRPAIWRGWPTRRHPSRPRPFSGCDLPGAQRAQMA